MLSRGQDVPRGGVGRRREQETDSYLADRSAGTHRRYVDADAERFQDVRGTGVGTDGAVAVFRYARARGGGNDRRGRGNVESAAIIAAGAAGVTFPGGKRHARSENRGGVSSDDAREAGNSPASMARIQRLQQADDVWRFDSPESSSSISDSASGAVGGARFQVLYQR